MSCPGVPSRRSGSAGPQGRTRRQSWQMKLHTCPARATSWVLPCVRWVCQSPSASLALSQGHHSSLEHLSLPGTQPVPSIEGCILDTPDFSSDLCPQEVLHIGSAHNRSAMPFTASPASSPAPRVITNQYNNPAGLYSSENISNFNNALESKTAASGQETNGRA